MMAEQPRIVPETPPGKDADDESNEYDSETLIENLDRTISRFGDASFSVPHKPSEAAFVRRFSPIGLEEAFQQLYSILYPCLCGNDSTTASAILMGPRGSGKSLLLERCLSACLESDKAKFRKVPINGICIRGEDVPSVVFEIIRQLSDLALEESTSRHASITEEQGGASNKRRRTEKYLLRLRKSPFTSNLSLLEATLKVAEVDGIPIVLILDELDSFTDEGERQLLLYHLLDRVATPGSNLCFIGLTSSFTTLSLLEKRIRSRAEGTSKIIYVRPPSTYDNMLQVIKTKLQGCRIQSSIVDLLSPTRNNDDQEASKIWACMEREFRLGKDLRWFSRVISCALSLYRYDCLEHSKCKFSPQHIVDALETMGASISDDSGTRSDFCLLNGVAVNPRLQALLDLAAPQVALLLCARRILARDAHQDHVTTPLTILRMMKEYESFRRGSTLPSLKPAVWQLLERGLLVPSSDHSGGGPLQYQSSSLYKNMDPLTISRMPMHLPIEVDREFNEALNKNLLDCSTALREWGRKAN
jgi:Cdc6-like AAA superfamily ATPase